MSRNPDLFDLAALSHADDPPTSHEAAAEHAASGKLTRHRLIVLAMVRRSPGRTACELWEGATPAEATELKEMQEVRRRLTDLHNAGFVRQGDPRPCRVKGTRQVTWETP